MGSQAIIGLRALLAAGLPVPSAGFAAVGAGNRITTDALAWPKG